MLNAPRGCAALVQTSVHIFPPGDCHFFPKSGTGPRLRRYLDNLSGEKSVQESPHLASAMLAIAFAAVMLVVGQQFLEYQARQHVVQLQPVKAKQR